ncbi:hypothetical protein KO494_04655 [Lacinutrix sp. C3R15]|uniref:DUF6891 domain-containing protein n=1 Tax=Flavobacteriaceae TaxID=49546 RepID=UPI001C09411B|nr:MULTISPECIES: hypothetical protein [Flavobacteriaceae]MBU2938827.1 hypothetical protein [Lacinutrix sp. C3R15]MDO6622140.1 hypothetical protein [Oceanihabitans sp. 1_MG-2023]
MTDEIKNEAIEQLEKDVLFGFENRDDLLESISGMFYDETDFDKNWLKKEIDIRLKNHQKESLNWKKPTDFERLVKSFDELNKNKIVSLHKAGYTKSDGEEDCSEIIDELKAIGINTNGYCYYHTQDLERAIGEEKMLFISFDSYNRDDELAKNVAEKIISVLTNNGFKTKWNGAVNTRIEILNIDWKKTVDNIDYNYGRVFEIIEKHHKPANNGKTKADKKPFWKI